MGQLPDGSSYNNIGEGILFIKAVQTLECDSLLQGSIQQPQPDLPKRVIFL